MDALSRGGTIHRGLSLQPDGPMALSLPPSPGLTGSTCPRAGGSPCGHWSSAVQSPGEGAAGQDSRRVPPGSPVWAGRPQGVTEAGVPEEGSQRPVRPLPGPSNVLPQAEAPHVSFWLSCGHPHRPRAGSPGRSREGPPPKVPELDTLLASPPGPGTPCWLLPTPARTLPPGPPDPSPQL